MKFPRAGQMVWIDGVKGTFTITAVHPGQGTVEVESTGVEKAHMQVTFDSIHALGEFPDRGASRKRENT